MNNLSDKNDKELNNDNLNNNQHQKGKSSSQGNLFSKFLKLKLLYIILILVAVVLFVFYPSMIKMGIMSNVFASKQIRIADTAIIVKEVKDITELFSIVHFDEIVIDSTEKRSKQLVYIAKGRVYAGFDLSNLNENAISVSDKQISIQLNKPKIIDVVVNPSDFTVFIEKGEWKFNEAQAVQIKAREKIRQRALENGILENSAKNGVRSLESFYKTLGFEEVNITILD